MTDSKTKARELAAEFGARRGFSADEVIGRGRSTSLVAVRREVYAAARDRFGWTNGEIAKAFDRDHGTVFNALKGRKPRHCNLDAKRNEDGSWTCVKCGVAVQDRRTA